MPSEAEQLLGKLRKLGANRECVNCGEKSRLGFGAVCVKFKTFVCNNCKSSHQAFSHRVKSVTMSTWTLEEVEELRKRNGGGNEVARAKWYAKWSSHDEERFAPKPGDNLDKFKQLIAMVYEDKRWYDESAGPEEQSAAPKKSRSPKQPKKSKPPSSVSSSSSDDLFGSLTIKGSSAPSTKLGAPEEELDLFGGGAASPAAAAPSAGGLSSDFDLMSLDAPAGPGFAATPAPLAGGLGGTMLGNPASSALGFDDPFAALERPKPVRATPQQVRQMQMQQQQMMMMQQQQQQIQQQQVQQPFGQGMGTQGGLVSDDPFAVLHSSVPRGVPRPMMMPSQPPMAMPRQGGPAAPPMQPMGSMQPMGFVPMARGPMAPRPMGGIQGNGGNPMFVGAGLAPASSLSRDDPFAGLQ